MLVRALAGDGSGFRGRGLLGARSLARDQEQQGDEPSATHGVMLSPGRKVAMISGEIVVLGGRYGSARLVRLTESEAVLKNGSETIVLRLFPLVEKRVAGSAKNSAGKTTK